MGGSWGREKLRSEGEKLRVGGWKGGGGGQEGENKQGWRIRRARNMDRDEEREEKRGKESKMAFFATYS